MKDRLGEGENTGVCVGTTARKLAPQFCVRTPTSEIHKLVGMFMDEVQGFIFIPPPHPLGGSSVRMLYSRTVRTCVT